MFSHGWVQKTTFSDDRRHDTALNRCRQTVRCLNKGIREAVSASKGLGEVREANVETLTVLFRARPGVIRCLYTIDKGFESAKMLGM